MAADSGIFVHWQRPIAGREGQAFEFLNSFNAYLSKQQQMGNIESYEQVLLAPHDTHLGGFILVRGSRQAIDKLYLSEDYQNLATQAVLMLKHFGIDHAYVGDGLKTQLGRFQKLVPQAKFEMK